MQVNPSGQILNTSRQRLIIALTASSSSSPFSLISSCHQYYHYYLVLRQLRELTPTQSCSHTAEHHDDLGSSRCFLRETDGQEVLSDCRLNSDADEKQNKFTQLLKQTLEITIGVLPEFLTYSLKLKPVSSGLL